MRHFPGLDKLLRAKKIPLSLSGIPRIPAKKTLARSRSDTEHAQTMLTFLRTHGEWLPKLFLPSKLRMRLSGPLFRGLPVFLESFCTGLRNCSERYQERRIYLEQRHKEAQVLQWLKYQLASLHDDVSDQLLFAQSDAYAEAQSIISELRGRLAVDRSEENLNDCYALGQAMNVLMTECPRPPKRKSKKTKASSEDREEVLAKFIRAFEEHSRKIQAGS